MGGCQSGLRGREEGVRQVGSAAPALRALTREPGRLKAREKGGRGEKTIKALEAVSREPGNGPPRIILPEYQTPK